MPVTFSFQERKYKIHAFVDRRVSDTPGDDRLYITVALRFEGLTGRSVFSGTAIAVPQDWTYYEPGSERNRVTKKGVQLALQRAIVAFFDYYAIERNLVEIDHRSYSLSTRYHEISGSFWKEFLNYVEEL